MLHHGQCYYPENCPCAWMGLEYLPGETVETPCYRWYITLLFQPQISSDTILLFTNYWFTVFNKCNLPSYFKETVSQNIKLYNLWWVCLSHLCFWLTVLICIHLSVSSVCAIVAILTVATHHVQLCVLSTATDTTTPSTALSMTTNLTVRSTWLKWVGSVRVDLSKYFLVCTFRRNIIINIQIQA